MSPTSSVRKGQTIRDSSARPQATAATRRSRDESPASWWHVRFSSWEENPPTSRRCRGPVYRLARRAHRLRGNRAPRRLTRRLGAWTSRLLRRVGGDDGDETVELAVLFPVALLILLAVVQAGLWWHAHTICRYAAIQAVQAVRTTSGGPGDAQAAAWEVLGRTGNATSAPTVTVAGGPVQVSVTVSATPLELIPLPGTVFRASYTAAAPRERFVPDAGGGG